MKLIHQILGLILGFIIGILTTLSGLGLLGLWVYSDTKKNPPKYRGNLYQPRPGPTYGVKNPYKFPLDHVYSSRSEAEQMLTALGSYISADGKVYLAELKTLLGEPPTLPDKLYGWTDLSQARTLQIRDGYVIEFPDPVKLKK